MDKFIKILNTVIPKELEDSYENDIHMGSYPFIYKTNITYDSNHPNYSLNLKYSPVLIAPLYAGIDSTIVKCNPNYFNQILFYLGQILKINILNIFKTKVLLQLPSSNTTPNNIHLDFPFSHWVGLYYINDSDGDTIFFDDDENEIKRVTPKKGQMVFFDGSIKHCSSPPTKTHRAIVNFNFIGEKY
jgi:hypothetical protein